MTFMTPINFLFILFFIAIYLYKKYRNNNAYIRFPDIDYLKDLKRSRFWEYLPTILIALSVVGLVAASADPQLETVEERSEIMALEIVLALDLSGSMRGKNIRLLKQTAANFAEEMREHRLGMVIYSEKAYIWCPPTNDVELFQEYLKRVNVSILGSTTAIGEGMLMSTYLILEPFMRSGHGINALRCSALNDSPVDFLKDNVRLPLKGKSIILFTDGMHNSGIKPSLVANLINKTGIRIYYLLSGYSNLRKEMKQAVMESGGRLYLMDDVTELESVYQEISNLEKGRTVVRNERRYKPLYPYFILGSIGIFGIGVGIKKIMEVK